MYHEQIIKIISILEVFAKIFTTKIEDLNTAIVILNWNGRHLLEKFLPSVVNFSQGHEIYLVDNASSDDSVAFVKQNHAKVKIIELDKNYGYARGYNNAVKKIDADILCFLNSDVLVTENWIEPIIDLFKNDAQTSVVQPKILDQQHPNQFEYAGAAGGFIDQLGYPYCRGRIFETLEKDTGQYNDSRPIFWASGACFFVRKKTFNTLNGFDETFFAHMEEIDFCWRAHNAGFGVMYTGNSTVYHVGGASLSKGNSKKTYYNFRNSLYALTKNSNHPLFVVIFIRLILDGVVLFGANLCQLVYASSFSKNLYTRGSFWGPSILINSSNYARYITHQWSFGRCFSRSTCVYFVFMCVLA